MAAYVYVKHTFMFRPHRPLQGLISDIVVFVTVWVPQDVQQEFAKGLVLGPRRVPQTCCEA